MDAELREKQEHKDVLARAAANVNSFNALSSRVDSLGTQMNRQGVLVQNIQERVGQNTQMAASVARVSG